MRRLAPGRGPGAGHRRRAEAPPPGSRARAQSHFHAMLASGPSRKPSYWLFVNLTSVLAPTSLCAGAAGREGTVGGVGLRARRERGAGRSGRRGWLAARLEAARGRVVQAHDEVVGVDRRAVARALEEAPARDEGAGRDDLGRAEGAAERVLPPEGPGAERSL